MIFTQNIEQNPITVLSIYSRDMYSYSNHRRFIPAAAKAFEEDAPPQKLPDLSRIMTLPAEIRALIFEHVVSCDPLVTYKLDPFLKDSYTEAVQPNITRVSRQIRAESLPLFYECNDFVLHTEVSKSDNTRRWLRCNAQYLSRIGCLSFWLRYMDRTRTRTISQGAFSLSLVRPKRQHDWVVDESWKWITVVKKPADVEADAAFLLRSLEDMLGEVIRPSAGPNDYYGLLTDLRMTYLSHKWS